MSKQNKNKQTSAGISYKGTGLRPWSILLACGAAFSGMLAQAAVTAPTSINNEMSIAPVAVPALGSTLLPQIDVTTTTAVTTTTPSRITALMRMYGFFSGGVTDGSTLTTTAATTTATPSVIVGKPGTTLDIKVLVLAATANDVTLPAIKQALGYVGIPYEVYVASQTPGALTALKLANGTNGLYSAIVCTTDSLGYSPDGSSWQSALAPLEWANLWAYESQFGVRQVNWYSYPNPTYGFNWPTSAVDTGAQPVDGKFTSAGSGVFHYVNTTNDLPIRMAYTYLATPLDAATTPLLTDDAGNALAAVCNHTDGRQTLSLTFDSNEYLVHNIALSYGLLNWANRGLFLGERHIYMSAQIDDVLIDDEMWQAPDFRINAADWRAVISWQKGVQANPLTRNLRLDMAFNGIGSTGIFPNDDLVPLVKQTHGLFKWISHTYDHENLDTMAYTPARQELTLNNRAATALGLTNYTRANLVTPDVSGLTNSLFLQAAWDTGVRYLVSDTSKPGYNNPSPNAGIYNKFQPGILMIPRYPVNLYYNVSTPEQWTSEYNFLYNAYWGRDFTYNDILDNQSQFLLMYMIKGDSNPHMYHQPNIRAYDGTHSLLGDLLDKTFEKYAKLYNLPLVSPTMDQLGTRVADRMKYNASGVKATVNGGTSITLSVLKEAVIPVTGLKTANAEVYGGQNIAWVRVRPGTPVTLPLR